MLLLSEFFLSFFSFLVFVNLGFMRFGIPGGVWNPINPFRYRGSALSERTKNQNKLLFKILKKKIRN